MSEKGITPVVAILLLLMMVVAAAGGAYVWIQNFQEQTQERAQEQVDQSLNTGIEFVSLRCINGSSTDWARARLRNSGDSELDVDPVDLRVREESTGNLVDSITEANLGDFLESGTGGGITSPGSSGWYNMTPLSFSATDSYRVTFVFTDENNREIESTCEL